MTCTCIPARSVVTAAEADIQRAATEVFPALEGAGRSFETWRFEVRLYMETDVVHRVHMEFVFWDACFWWQCACRRIGGDACNPTGFTPASW
jgi:hypothetical protein